MDIAYSSQATFFSRFFSSQAAISVYAEIKSRVAVIPYPLGMVLVSTLFRKLDSFIFSIEI